MQGKHPQLAMKNNKEVPGKELQLLAQAQYLSMTSWPKLPPLFDPSGLHKVCTAFQCVTFLG